MTCPHCVDSEGFFDEKAAKRDLRRYRKRGPRATSAHLVEVLSPLADGATLLDIGGGVGLIQHELFGAGLQSAIQADASTAYLATSQEEAARRGHRDRVTYLHGDFVDLADEIPPVDLVVLDRVVCCYPEVTELISKSTSKALVAFGVVLPRRNLLTRLMLGMANTFLRLRGNGFRTFLHPVELVEDRIVAEGFTLVGESGSLLWESKVYRRSGTAAANG